MTLHPTLHAGSSIEDNDSADSLTVYSKVETHLETWKQNLRRGNSSQARETASKLLEHVPRTSERHYGEVNRVLSRLVALFDQITNDEYVSTIPTIELYNMFADAADAMKGYIQNPASDRAAEYVINHLHEIERQFRFRQYDHADL